MEKLNKKSGVAKIPYENGLGLANSNYSPTSDFNETLSSIAQLRGHCLCDWRGQNHPLMVIFSNYALKNDDLVNVEVGYDSGNGNTLSFGVSSEKINGKSPQDSFYEWTSSFAEDKIFGSEKGKYSEGRGWRMAVIVGYTIVTTPFFRVPL
ncbi:MAG: hypothetical protein AAGG81_04280 [Chlamydiota bacterium]